jgi:hypothetical protein
VFLHRLSLRRSCLGLGLGLGLCIALSPPLTSHLPNSLSMPLFPLVPSLPGMFVYTLIESMFSDDYFRVQPALHVCKTPICLLEMQISLRVRSLISLSDLIASLFPLRSSSSDADLVSLRPVRVYLSNEDPSFPLLSCITPRLPFGVLLLHALAWLVLYRISVARSLFLT